jgi:hypothetical protein
MFHSQISIPARVLNVPSPSGQFVWVLGNDIAFSRVKVVIKEARGTAWAVDTGVFATWALWQCWGIEIKRGNSTGAESVPGPPQLGSRPNPTGQTFVKAEKTFRLLPPFL